MRVKTPSVDDLDARARRDQALQAHAQADGVADRLAQSRGHARRGGAGGEAARLEQHQTLAFRPRLIEQGQGRARCFAGAGRGDEHRAGVGVERGAQRAEHVVDRERRGGTDHSR